MIIFNAFSEKENIDIFHLELTNVSQGTRSGIFSLFVSKQKVVLTTLLVNFLIGFASRILILKNILKPGSMTACNIMTGILRALLNNNEQCFTYDEIDNCNKSAIFHAQISNL